MKSARKVFRTGFTCPYIADEIRPQKIFGQALPVPTFFVKVAQHFNAGQSFTLSACAASHKLAKTALASTGFSTFSSPTTLPSRNLTIRWQ